MALLESRLTRKCCRKPRFDCQYNDDLKQFITRKSLASDLKDISETFHANQPSVCFYNVLPIIMVLADIALCITLIVYEQIQWIHVLYLLSPIVVMCFLIWCCGKRCSKRKWKRNVLEYVEHINSERKYKEKNIHWEMEEIKGGKPLLVLLKGNPNNKTVSRSSGSQKDTKITMEKIKALKTMKGIKEFVEDLVEIVESIPRKERGSKLHHTVRHKIGVPKGTYLSALKLVRAIEMNDEVFINDETARMTVDKFVENVLGMTRKEIDGDKKCSKNIAHYVPCISSVIKTDAVRISVASE